MAKISQNTMTALFNMVFFFSLCSEKPPDDYYQKRRYFKSRQQYTRFLRFYGNSLVGGNDQAKIITVTETEAKKKTRKNKQGRTVSFDKGLNQYYTILSKVPRISSHNFCLLIHLHHPVKKKDLYSILYFFFTEQEGSTNY